MGVTRTDQKKRKLKTGEGQRKNGLYYYRYKEPFATKWSFVYSMSLQELRVKEREIAKALKEDIPYKDSRVTVKELVDQYMGMKHALSENSKRAYATSINRIKETSLANMSISNVKISDAKKFCAEMYEKGYKFNTINVAKTILQPAFQLAVEDDLIRKNPFNFKLTTVVPAGQKNRMALTVEQENELLGYELRYSWLISQTKDEPVTLKKADDINSFYNEMVILLGTGMRVSELCGLTLADIDFENNAIHVNKQLCRTANKLYYVAPPKSASGNRVIPMSESVRTAFQNVIKQRGDKKCRVTVDGYSNFVFLTKNRYPQVAYNVQGHVKDLVKWIQKTEDPNFPKVTPHVFRHTFCSRMQSKMDLKCLQYIMGHSKADVTLDVYSHVSYQEVEQSFARAMEIS